MDLFIKILNFLGFSSNKKENSPKSAKDKGAASSTKFLIHL